MLGVGGPSRGPSITALNLAFLMLQVAFVELLLLDRSTGFVGFNDLLNDLATGDVPDVTA